MTKPVLLRMIFAIRCGSPDLAYEKTKQFLSHFMKSNPSIGNIVKGIE